jgi:drug/metabolite transporter (DMT)-like permease
MQKAPFSRPLDTFAVLVALMLCLSWGLNQVAIKLSIAEVPPMVAATARSVVAALVIGLWVFLRGIKLDFRDGTFWLGLAVGFIFAVEFVAIYWGLQHTSASRGVLFIYTAPFFVALGAWLFLPNEKLRGLQWAGLVCSFIGVALGVGAPVPQADAMMLAGDLAVILGGLLWGVTTIMVKATRLRNLPAEQVMIYSVAGSVPFLAAAIPLFGETLPSPGALSAVAWGAMAYQALWVVSVTYLIWYMLIRVYSASALSAFSFPTPLFGIAAGHLILGEPLTPAFLMAAVLVVVGLVLVNRT